MDSNNRVYAIGGVGGSGTRVIAELLMRLGYFMGDDLNESNDNLLFTLLFKRESILVATNEEFEILLHIFLKHHSLGEPLSREELSLARDLASKDRAQHSKEWLQKRLLPLDRSYKHTRWGFKEPNSHIIIERLFAYMPQLHYIYLYRDGRDMAYSSNQNQLNLWGAIFASSKEFQPNVKNSLKYWLRVHTRMMQLCNRYSGRILMVDFDKLCLDPESQLAKIAAFLQRESGELLAHRELIKTPPSIGRYKQHPLSNFDPEDLEKIEKIYGAF